MSTEHVDVLIVGAGLSGIGAACHLHDETPGRTFAILESRATLGGTWDLFRYPGIRSDSDMFTLGYSFRPWHGAKAIADGASIRDYLIETARDYRLEERIRFNHKVISADWSSSQARWTVLAERSDTGAQVEFTCSFLSSCSGYYRYDEGYTPHFEGRERFTGQVVHPQHWPADLDYAGKRVVVIGSGATAVTLVPALAESAAHVSMLQRSPSYVTALPAKDALADRLRRYLPAGRAHSIVRWKNVLVTMASFQLSRRRPKVMKWLLRKGVSKQLPDGYEVDKHFAPRYDPWDQRLCIVPDGDLFRAIRHGKAAIETDRIETFTETGIQLASGKHLDADVIVTATGLNLLALGGLRLSVDGVPVELANTLTYKGMMLSGVPNFSLTIGYTNASWTLKADLVAHYVCRLLKYLDANGYQIVTPIADPVEDWSQLDPIIDLQAGYVLRSVQVLPKQGAAAPWRLYQNYLRDVRLMKRGTIEDNVLFSHATVPSTQ